MLVINRNDHATLKATGETISAVKIRERIQVGWQGWSGGCRPAYAYGVPRWVKSDLLNNTKGK